MMLATEENLCLFLCFARCKPLWRSASAHIIQCKYRRCSIKAVSGLVTHLCTLRLLISIFYLVKTDVIRGQATLQLGVSGSCCCHAVILSAAEDNKDSPSGHRGQHSGWGQGVTEGKGRKCKRY